MGGTAGTEHKGCPEFYLLVSPFDFDRPDRAVKLAALRLEGIGVPARPPIGEKKGPLSGDGISAS
jgi:hypothetical protein